MAGRALAGGIGPRLVKDQRGAVAGAMAPANTAVTVLSSVRAGPGNASRFPARARRPPADRQVREVQRPAPDPAGAKRPPGAGRALARGFGPRLVKRQRCDVSEAMAPAIAAVEVPAPLRAGPGNAARFPRPRTTVPCRPVGPGTTKGQRPTRRVASARHGRGGRWPGALAPRLVLMPMQRCGRGDGPCHSSGDRGFVSVGGIRKRSAFPPPSRDGALQTGRSGRNAGQRPARRGRSARRGRGGRWPGAVAPGWSRGSVAQWQGRWPLPERPCIPKCKGPPLRAGSRNAPRFPRPGVTPKPGPAPLAPQRACARPGGGKAPAGGGSGAGRGLRPPAGMLHTHRVAGTMAPAGTPGRLSSLPPMQPVGLSLPLHPAGAHFARLGEFEGS